MAESVVTEPTPDAAADVPAPRRWLVFVIAASALLMVSVDQTIVATALTSIQTDLSAELTWTGWTITVYALGQIIAMPVAGRLSDQFGRRRTFLVAIAVFIGASICCGLADNIYLLIAFRAVQALGGGAFLPSATGLVVDQFGPNRDRAVGMLTSVFPIGAMVGPVLGGLFVEYSSWRMIFFVNVPVGIVLLIATALVVHDHRVRSPARVDYPGIALLATFLLSAMFGITVLGTPGVHPLAVRFLGAEALALVAGWLFLRHARRSPSAIVPIGLLRGHGFSIMHVINMLLGAATIGFGSLVPLYVERRYGLDPLAAGTLLTFRAVGMICTAGLAVMLMRRIGHRTLMFLGFSALSTGVVLMSLAPPPGIVEYAWFALAAGITGVGMGIATPSSSNATLHLAPDHVAAIAGLRGMSRQVGAIIMVSATTAVLSRSTDPDIAQAHVFTVFAMVLLAGLLLVARVPDHRGSW